MNLEKFFNENKKVALAFSGGVDSSYLLYAALNYGVDVKPYYVKSAFQPQFEYEDALKLGKQLNTPITVIEVDVLTNDLVSLNKSDRCYHCKNTIFDTIIKRAKDDGYDTLLDGTNASDDYDDRPGMRALEELKVMSPLRLCGMTKDEIRKKSKEAGLFTWDKPSYACLATRIETNEELTHGNLKRTEIAEDFLMSLGFSDFRVRTIKNSAKIQVKEFEFNKIIENRAIILKKFKTMYDSVLLDLESRDE